MTPFRKPWDNCCPILFYRSFYFPNDNFRAEQNTTENSCDLPNSYVRHFFTFRTFSGTFAEEALFQAPFSPFRPFQAFFRFSDLFRRKAGAALPFYFYEQRHFFGHSCTTCGGEGETDFLSYRCSINSIDCIFNLQINIYCRDCVSNFIRKKILRSIDIYY